MDQITVTDSLPYCVYHHIADGVVFYVGSGSSSRPFQRKGRTPGWIAHVKSHAGYKVEIVRWFEYLGDARTFESAEIKRLNPIVNIRVTSTGEPKGKTRFTTLVSFRVSEGLAQLIETRAAIRKQTKTAVILEAIRGSFETPVIQPVIRSDMATPQSPLERALAIPGVRRGYYGDHGSDDILPREDDPPDPERDPLKMCTYIEYDTDTGDSYRCSLPAHGAMVKHRRGDKV